MKTAKIYFEGNLVCTVGFKTIMYIEGRELRGKNNELIAVIPNSHMIVIEENETRVFEVSKDKLIGIIKNNDSDRNNII